jgi:hypothetical protein
VIRLLAAFALAAGCSSRAPAPPPPAAAPPAPPSVARLRNGYSPPRVGELHATLAEVTGAELPPQVDSTLVVGELSDGGASWNAMAAGWGRRPGISGISFRLAGRPAAGRDYALVALPWTKPGAPRPELADGQAAIVFTEGAEHEPTYWTADQARLEVTALDGETLSFRVRDAHAARLDRGAAFRVQLDGKARLRRR